MAYLKLSISYKTAFTNGQDIRALWCIIYLLLCVCVTEFPAQAQSLILRPSDILPELQITDQPDRYYINGTAIHTDQAERNYIYGPFSQVLLSVTALRLVDEGKIDLDMPLYQALGSYVEDIAFRVAVTPRHLLSGTAGYSVPYWYGRGEKLASQSPFIQGLTANLDPYIITARWPDQTFYDDPVARALLAELISKSSGLSLTAAIQTYVSEPLGLEAAELEILYNKKGYSLFPGSRIKGPLSLVNALLIKLMSFDTSKFLTPVSKSLLIEKLAWGLHPLADGRTLGLSWHKVPGYTMLSPGYPCLAGVTFILLPQEDIAFVSPKGASDCPDTFTKEIVKIARRHIPPKNTNPAAGGPQIQEISSPRGLYIKETAPTSQLNERLTRIYENILSVTPTADGIEISQNGIKSRFQRQSPYAFINDQGHELYFSTSPGGGFFTLGGETYRFIGLLGDARLVLAPFPWSLILLFSAAIYLYVGSNVTWRRMGLMATVGAFLVSAGLYLELNFWHHIIYEADLGWIVSLWRIMLNVGLALILSIPLYALYFSKNNEMPSGMWILVAPIHLTLLTAAALILFLIMISWGIGGEFAPY